MATKKVSDGELTRLALAPGHVKECKCLRCVTAKLAQECIDWRRGERNALNNPVQKEGQ